MKILILAPNFQLMETCKAVVSEYKVPITVLLGDLQDGLRIARGEVSKHRADLIVSRGGTASLLRENLEVPVFDINVTGFDLLRSIQPHAAMHKKIAVIGYENVVSGARSIAEILGFELGYFQISSTTDIASRINDAKEWGAEVIVGDTISVRTARELGLSAEIVESGPEAIIQALDAAIDFYKQVQTEIIRSRRLSLILEQNEQGILYVNSKGCIELSNSVAEKLLSRDKDTLVGMDAESGVAPPLLSEAIDLGPGEHIIEAGGMHLVVEILPLGRSTGESPYLVFMQSSSRIRDLEAMIRKRMTSSGLVAGYHFNDIIAVDSGFRKTVAKARKYAMTDATVLLLGETGVGKEIFAQSIHNGSTRSSGPFVGVNCAALPDSLLESELFGYADGAFTGARKGGKPGLFEMSHLGTIFLDEVNDMSMKVQARFLRVLQEKQIMRVGGDRLVDIDVRVIAASNKNLDGEADSGRFRKDLYYRLRVLDVEIPPLRDRKDDIKPLVESFMRTFAEKNAYAMPRIPKLLHQAVLAYEWPGNIRQLRNFAEKTCILLSIHEYSDEIIEDLIKELGVLDNSHGYAVRTPSSSQTFEELQREIIRAKWEANGRNISKTSRELGLDRATVRKKLGGSVPT